MDYCLACREPFDKVHPLDFTNDWTCAEMHRNDYDFYPPGYPICRENHTWREHVQESYQRRGQSWCNRHIRVPEWNYLSDDLICERNA